MAAGPRPAPAPDAYTPGDAVEINREQGGAMGTGDVSGDVDRGNGHAGRATGPIWS